MHVGTRVDGKARLQYGSSPSEYRCLVFILQGDLARMKTTLVVCFLGSSREMQSMVLHGLGLCRRHADRSETKVRRL